MTPRHPLTSKACNSDPIDPLSLWSVFPISWQTVSFYTNRDIPSANTEAHSTPKKEGPQSKSTELASPCMASATAVLEKNVVSHSLPKRIGMAPLAVTQRC